MSPGKLDEIELSDVSKGSACRFGCHERLCDFHFLFFFQSAVRMGPVWQTYVFEMVMVGGLVFYLVSYFVGRTKNSNMAYSW